MRQQTPTTSSAYPAWGSFLWRQCAFKISITSTVLQIVSLRPIWLMSVVDAVDGSSTGTRVPWMWVLIRPHDSEEPNHASDHDNRSRYCEVGFSGPRHRCGRQSHASPPAQAPLRASLLSEAAAMPDRD